MGEHQATKMTPVDFARAYGKGLQPQLIYYYIRTHKLAQVHCDCGRKVIDIIEATEFFDSLEKKTIERRKR
jgi:hypothetical protein